MYLYGFFQTDVLLNFFIPPRRAEAITLVKFRAGNAESGQHKRRIPPYRDETFYKKSQI